jgi:hypothetical protein
MKMRIKNKLIVVLAILILLLLAKLTVAENQYLELENNHIELIEELNNKETELNNIKNELETLEYTLDEIEKEDNEWIALVDATFRLETGNGTSNLWLNYNNAGGIKCGNVYCVYDTKENGLQALKTLLERYIIEFGYDIKSIRNKYCPIYDKGCIDDYENFKEIYNEELEKVENYE